MSHPDYKYQPWPEERRRRHSAAARERVQREKAERRLPAELSERSAIERLIAKFPDFDPAWSDEIKAEWLDAYARVLEIARPIIRRNRRD